MLILPLLVEAGAAHTACVPMLLAPAPLATQSAHVTVRIEAGARLWKRFGPLHVHTPEAEYILVLKITAGSQKDLEDRAIQLPNCSISAIDNAGTNSLSLCSLNFSFWALSSSLKKIAF